MQQFQKQPVDQSDLSKRVLKYIMSQKKGRITEFESFFKPA